MTNRSTPSEQALRDGTIAILLAIVFLATGSCAPPGMTRLIGMSPFNLDISLRALGQGWYPTDRTVPVTIVDIDEATQSAWNRPASTPRGELASLLTAVTAAGARAVVVDIDLSWGGMTRTVDSGDVRLRRMLESHRGTLLVFPKRLVLDSAGRSTAAPSGFDDLIGVRPELRWANATFTTEGGGAVRRWEEWAELCEGGVARRLPAVATVIAAPGDTATASPAPCGTGDPAPTRRLLVGPRMTGPTRVPTARVQAISAALLLDSTVARNDSALFSGRIVLIGATHADAGDLWLTPAGVVPGVELLASTIHFAPLALSRSGGATVGFRLATVITFLGLALGTWWLTGIATVIVILVAMLLATSLAVGLFDWFWYFDAAAVALGLIMSYEAIRALMEYGIRVHDEVTRRSADPGMPPRPLFFRIVRGVLRAGLRKQVEPEARK